MNQDQMNYIKQQTLKAIDLIEGKTAPPDIPAAIPLLVNSSREGDNLASAFLGMNLLMYNDQDDINYLKLIQDAFDKRGQINHAKTEGDINCFLAICYLNGWGGLITDKEKAFQLIKAGLSAGGNGPYTYMGLCYMSGIGVVKDENVALKYLKKGSQEGSATSKYYMAIIESKNLWNTFYVGKWFAEAAQEGCAPAMVENAILLKNTNKFALAEEMARKAIQYSGGDQNLINRASEIIRDMGGIPPRYIKPILPEVFFDEKGLPTMDKPRKNSLSKTNSNGGGLWSKIKKILN